MNWTAFPAQPSESGAYIIANRMQAKDTWYDLPRPTQSSVNMGWDTDPRLFGATHWAPYKSPPSVSGKVQRLKPLEPGTVVRFTQNRTYPCCPMSAVARRWSFHWKSFKWVKVSIPDKMTRATVEVSAGDTGYVDEMVNPWEEGLTYAINIHGHRVVLGTHAGYAFEPINGEFEK